MSMKQDDRDLAGFLIGYVLYGIAVVFAVISVAAFVGAL